MVATLPDRSIRSVAFRKEREAGWFELEGLIELVGKKGIKELTAEQAARLPHLYRATLSALSVARSISLDRALTEYLESLCGRAYFCVYGTREPARHKIVEFLAWGWPSAVRKVKWQLLVSFVLLVLGTLTSFFMVRDDPENYYTFVPAAYAQGRDPAATNEQLRAVLYDQQDFSGTLSHFAATLFSHNAGIGILAFALGFAVIPTALMMFINGLILGAVIMLFIAGLIEGIFRQVVTSLEVRWGVATLTALFWTWYFTLCGRERERQVLEDREAQL